MARRIFLSPTLAFRVSPPSPDAAAAALSAWGRADGGPAAVWSHAGEGGVLHFGVVYRRPARRRGTLGDAGAVCEVERTPTVANGGVAHNASAAPQAVRVAIVRPPMNAVAPSPPPTWRSPCAARCRTRRIDTLDAASAWWAVNDTAVAWSSYVGAQEGLAWSGVLALLARMKPVFQLAVAADPDLALEFPTLSRLLDTRSAMVRRSQIARAANKLLVAAGKEPTHGKTAARRKRARKAAGLDPAEAPTPKQPPIAANGG